MEKGVLAGQGLTAVILLSSLGNSFVKPMPEDVNSKLDTIIQQNSDMSNSINLNTYRINQLERARHEKND